MQSKLLERKRMMERETLFRPGQEIRGVKRWAEEGKGLSNSTPERDLAEEDDDAVP